MIRVAILVLLLTSGVATLPFDASAQTTTLESLLAEADSASPRIAAARSVADGAAARVPQAGALPDPMLGIGVMNVPVTDPGIGNDMMTMTQLQLSTRFPWPGKLGLREDAAAVRAEAAEWEIQRARNHVRAEVEAAYYEIYFVDRAIAVTTRNGTLLGRLADLTTSQYAVGSGRQPDVLKAQVERTRLADQRVTLRERRSRAEARLNALLGRPTDTPVLGTVLPDIVRAAALAGGGDVPAFTSAALEPVAADSSPERDGTRLLPDILELQRLAREHNPSIRAQELRAVAEDACFGGRVEASRRERFGVVQLPQGTRRLRQRDAVRPHPGLRRAQAGPGRR